MNYVKLLDELTTNLIITGNIDDVGIEMLLLDIPEKNNKKVLKLTNGWKIHKRIKENYTWIHGYEGDEDFELGIPLFLTMARMNTEYLVANTD